MAGLVPIDLPLAVEELNILADRANHFHTAVVWGEPEETIRGCRGILGWQLQRVLKMMNDDRPETLCCDNRIALWFEFVSGACKTAIVIEEYSIDHGDGETENETHVAFRSERRERLGKGYCTVVDQEQVVGFIAKIRQAASEIAAQIKDNESHAKLGEVDSAQQKLLSPPAVMAGDPEMVASVSLADPPPPPSSKWSGRPEEWIAAANFDFSKYGCPDNFFRDAFIYARRTANETADSIRQAISQSPGGFYPIDDEKSQRIAAKNIAEFMKWPDIKLRRGRKKAANS